MLFLSSPLCSAYHWNICIAVAGQFVCNSSCPADREYKYRGLCLTQKEYAKESGRFARETRDRIIIGASVALIAIMAIIIILWLIWMKRRADAERNEKLRSLFANLSIVVDVGSASANLCFHFVRALWAAGYVPGLMS